MVVFRLVTSQILPTLSPLSALMSSNPFPIFCDHSPTYQNCVQISLANRNAFCLALSNNRFTREFIIFVTGAWNVPVNSFLDKRVFGGVVKRGYAY